MNKPDNYWPISNIRVIFGKKIYVSIKNENN